jgi:hypothetical protein
MWGSTEIQIPFKNPDDLERLGQKFLRFAERLRKNQEKARERLIEDHGDKLMDCTDKEKRMEIIISAVEAGIVGDLVKVTPYEVMWARKVIKYKGGESG